MRRTLFGDEHDVFRETVRKFIGKEVAPDFPKWEQEGLVPKSVYERAGDLGLVGIQAPIEYGGGGESTFTFNAILIEELIHALVPLGGLTVHINVVTPYFLRYCSDEQKARWLPGMAAGRLTTAIAMTEPGTGSDLAGIKTTARRDGDHYVLNGAKTFITGGMNADMVIVVARTGTDEGNRRTGLSLLVVERGMSGFSRGQNLHKLGLKAQDTTELFFDDVRVPASNLLGEEGEAFHYLTSNLPQERLAIAIGSQAAAATALHATVKYVTNRPAFGGRVSDFQNTKFTLAECATDVEAGQVFVDRALEELNARTLAPADAAKAKLFCSELQARVVDKCVQLHGGYGFVLDYPITRLYADARVSRIYGGTSEIMKSVISRSIGL